MKAQAPFVTVLLPVYNEVKVIDRLLEAVTSIDYPSYEIVVADDSTDKGMLQHLEAWKKKGIKVVHRDSRSGFKAGALNNAMKHVDRRCEYLLFFDADCVPSSDMIWPFIGGFSSKEVAAVQGYTNNTLNASQNFLTKSASTSTSSYCLVDIPVRKRLDGFIPLFGSTFMLSRSALEAVGGFNEASITEDWDLAAKLAEKGYTIVFDEGISAPAECPRTFRSLLRQQMRWAEGVTRDTKNNLRSMLGSRKVNLMKKLDFLFYGFGAFNGILGTLAYVLTVITFLIDERIIVILGVDRSLILGLGLFGQLLLFVAPVYIPVAIFLYGFVGLYRDGRASKFPWCIYLFAMGLVMAPFVAFAGLKGLFLKRGSWARTPKAGETN